MVLWLAVILMPIIRMYFGFAQDVKGYPNTVHCHSLNPENYTCAHCIQLDPSCAWCSDQEWEQQKGRYRCDLYSRLTEEHACKQIEYPKSRRTINEDKPLSNTGVEDPESAVLVKPQEITLHLRPKETFSVPLTFRQALDYPVDLYYLMDMSRSMKDDKEKLSVLGDLLADRMRTITKNFRLGFGSFVDKKVAPFVDARPSQADKPCSGCVPPYGFKNHMPLSMKTSEFARKVNETAVSGNLDAPEGGFDAVMQSLACPRQIGWRSKSRKMIVYSSDAGFHYAGDARLGGIVIPNDGECHLNERHEYTMSTEQDYPSVAQLHQKIRLMKANLIFAVTSDQVPLYKNLKNALPEVSTSVGELATDSSNIVDLVQEEYEKISEKIIMVDTASEPVKVSYKTKCKGANWEDTNVCDGIKVGDEVIYNISIQVAECGVDEKPYHEFTIGPSGLTDVLKVKLHVLCSCGCEKNAIQNHPNCSSKGSMTCGVCECSGDNRGRKCECPSPGKSTAQLDAQCRRGNDTRSPICEGRGTCECGRCVCKVRTNPAEVVSGLYCECDNFNCPRHNRQICNGHGKCDCRACACDEGWSGRACECATSEENCRASNGRICNGKGYCQCGVCRCFTTDDKIRFSGPTCEICPTCPDECQQQKPCVQCLTFGTGPYSEKCNEECDMNIVKQTELPHENSTTSHCQALDKSDGCTFYWAINNTNDGVNMTVFASTIKDCPPPPPVLAIVLGLIGAIVLIGLLLLLLLKLLTFLHDRREYQNFQAQSTKAKWATDDNPIYHPATTTFQNPAYRGKQL